MRLSTRTPGQSSEPRAVSRQSLAYGLEAQYLLRDGRLGAFLLHGEQIHFVGRAAKGKFIAERKLINSWLFFSSTMRKFSYFLNNQ